MADLKISQLTGATTPLAGTEVLPIVQSSSTKKIATDDLTVKNIRSNATSGILQVAGPAVAATRVMTTPNANFTVARIDAAQSFTGNQTLTDGNLVIGTSGKGIDFSATSHPAGMTSELLNDYEEGTWTGGVSFGGGTTGITYAAVACTYTKTGRQVHAEGLIYLSNKGSSTGAARITGLPFTASGYSAASIEFQAVASTGQRQGFVQGGTTIELRSIALAGTETDITNTDFANNSILIVGITYNA